MNARSGSLTASRLSTLRSAFAGLALGFCATLPLGACDDESGGCVQGSTQQCVCAEGMGAQTCQEDGSWGACSCGGSASGGGGDGGDGGDGSGGAGDSNASNGDGGTPPGDGGDEFSCCINGSFYDCPNADASGVCFSQGNPSMCQADANRDAECDSGDSADSAGSADSGGGGGSSGTCSDPGESCSVHDDCCDSDVLCVDGTCAAACSFGSDCASGCCADLEGGGGACAPANYCG